MFSEAFVCTEGEGLLGRCPLEPETLSLEAEPPPSRRISLWKKKSNVCLFKGKGSLLGFPLGKQVVSLYRIV